MQKVDVKREFETPLLSTQQYIGTVFELGKDKAAIGEGWAPSFISCAQNTVGL